MASPYWFTPGLVSAWHLESPSGAPHSTIQSAEGHIAFLAKNGFTEPPSSNVNAVPASMMTFSPPNTTLPPPQLAFLPPPPLLPSRSSIISHIPRNDHLYPSTLSTLAPVASMEKVVSGSEATQSSIVSSTTNYLASPINTLPPTVMYLGLNHSEASFVASQNCSLGDSLNAFPHNEQDSGQQYQSTPVSDGESDDDDNNNEEAPLQFQLPRNWRRAIDSKGNAYFYHMLTRETSWNLPSSDDDEENIEPMSLLYSERNVEQGHSSISSPADTSRIHDERSLKNAKDRFRTKVSEFVVQRLGHYSKKDCNSGRITCTEDFKYLARKLTNFVMFKQLKRCNYCAGELEFTESVKNKAGEFIKAYMSKYGAIYKQNRSIK